MEISPVGHVSGPAPGEGAAGPPRSNSLRLPGFGIRCWRRNAKRPQAAPGEGGRWREGSWARQNAAPRGRPRPDLWLMSLKASQSSLCHQRDDGRADQWHSYGLRDTRVHLSRCRGGRTTPLTSESKVKRRGGGAASMYI